MPPSRDEQDYESRRRQIIDGALHVFAGKGFEKATNREIASAAGIGSPGLIYHYFKDKKDLFKQVVETYAPALQLIARGEEMMDMPPREALNLFATTFVSMLDNRATMAMFKMMLGEAVRRPAVGEIFNTIGPGRGFPFLVRYFSHQMDKGTFRRMDPGAAVRCFIGPLIVFILSREVFVQADAQTLSPEKMVETAVDVFLHGMEVPGGK